MALISCELDVVISQVWARLDFWATEESSQWPCPGEAPWGLPDGTSLAMPDNPFQTETSFLVVEGSRGYDDFSRHAIQAMSHHSYYYFHSNFDSHV